MELPSGVLSTACAFCDSPLVDSDAVAEAPPDHVVPFVVPRDRAGRLLSQFLAGRWLAPESVRRASSPDELEQVFVPFYAYDALVRTRFSCRVGVHWYRTETYTTTVNGKTAVRTRRVQETEWFPLDGSHARRWFDHLVSASRGLPESEANDLEPFDLGQAMPYAPALTAGVAAELPTVDHGEAEQVARTELAALEKQTIAHGHLPGDTHRELTSHSDVEVDAVRLLLLPVWTAVFAGGGQPLRLLVNGQTGEVVGTVPRSRWKIGCLVAAVVVPLLLLLFGSLLFGGIAALLGAS